MSDPTKSNSSDAFQASKDWKFHAILIPKEGSISKQTYSEPTMMLRWVRPWSENGAERQLEQKWLIRRFENGIQVDIDEEWREVEMAND